MYYNNYYTLQFFRSSFQIHWILSIQQCIRVGSSASAMSLITKSVPHGSILGPLLFNMMVNEMLSSHTQPCSYDDDTLTYSSGPTQHEAIRNVTLKFDALNRWYKNNGLGLCIEKTKCLVISNCRIDTIKLLHYRRPIERSIVQLGVILDSKLNFNEHLQSMLTKCNNLVYVLHKIRHLITCEEAKLIYTSIIRPKIECYCSLFKYPQFYLRK